MLELHQDHIAEKGYNTLFHCGSVHTQIPMTKAMKIPDAKVAVDKEGKKLKLLAWDASKVRVYQNVNRKAHAQKKPVVFTTLIDLCAT